MMGMHGEAFVNSAIQRADLLLAFGMRFDDRVTGNLKTYAPHAKKIHVEIDPSEIDKNVQVDVALVGDLRAALRALPPIVAAKRHEGWLREIETGREETRARDIVHQRVDGQLLARARHPRPVAGDGRRRRRSSPTSASTRCGRRSTTCTSARAP